MFESIPDPLLYGFTVFLFGGWLGLFLMVRLLFSGRLCTGRELSEKNARIVALEDALRSRDEQVDAALHVLPEVAEVLHKFHVAAIVAASSPGADQ